MQLYSYSNKRYHYFLIGIARILDITASLSPYKYLYKSDPEFEDFKAISNDWKFVISDIKNSMDSLSALTKRK